MIGRRASNTKLGLSFQLHNQLGLRLFVFPRAVAEDFDFHLGDAARVEAEAFGAADGDVDDASFNVGAAVGDAEDL